MISRNPVAGCIRQRLCIFLRQPFNRASTSSVASTEVPSDERTSETDVEVVEGEEDDSRITEMCDISRMRSWHRTIINGQPPPMDTFKWQKERWALKERYAMYGRASGVDPGVLWPTLEELDEMRQEDDELHPKLEQTVEQMHQLRTARAKEIEDRYVDVEKKAKEYPKLIAEYRNKLKAQQAAIDEEKRAKDDKIKEIQSYFGYAIDVTDPRFAAMMAKKEMEERQIMKKKRKKDQELEALRKIEEETKLLKQREQLQFQAAKTEKSEEGQAKAKA